MPATALAQGAAAPAPAQETQDSARPAVAKALNEAAALIQASRFPEALAKVNEAEAVGNLTPYETMVTQRMRGSAASRAGNNALAVEATEGALLTGKLSASEQVDLNEALVRMAFNQKDYARVIRWVPRYYEAGGTNEALKLTRVQALLLTGDGATATRELSAFTDAALTAGRPVSENLWRLLRQEQRKLGLANDETRTLERLAVAYPKPEYWAELVGRAVETAKIEERVLLDVFRLLRTVGATVEAPTFVAHAQLALLAGQPGEAERVLDDGYKAQRLGTGGDAAEHAKLREQARKAAAADRAQRAAGEKAAQSAKDGNALFGLGLSMALEGDARGLQLMQEGVTRGGLRRPAEAQLQLGGQLLAAGRADEARKAFGLAKGPDGLDEVARLWTLWASARR